MDIPPDLFENLPSDNFQQGEPAPMDGDGPGIPESATSPNEADGPSLVVSTTVIHFYVLLGLILGRDTPISRLWRKTTLSLVNLSFSWTSHLKDPRP